jgi:hypothetical protein
LEAALEGLIAEGIDAKPFRWDPEVITDPPQRAGIHVPLDKVDATRRILEADMIPFVDGGEVTP